MRWAGLLLLLPLAFSLPAATQSLILNCNGPVQVEYSLDGKSVVFFHSENTDPTVAKYFLAYVKLSSGWTHLQFLNDATLTSLSSLRSSLNDYNLSLVQAETIARRYGVELNVGGLKKKAMEMDRTVERIEREARKLRKDLHSFLESPDCNFTPDLSALEDVDDVRFLGNQILSTVEREKTGLVEQNADLIVINAVIRLITPPFDRSQIDDLYARAQADRTFIEGAFNPDVQEIEDLLGFSQDYEMYKSTVDLLNQEIITNYRSFPDVQTTITFLISLEDSLENRAGLVQIKKLYGKVKKDLEEGKYQEAYYEAKKLRSLIVKYINENFKREEENDQRTPWTTIFFILLLIALIFWLVRRGKKGEEELDDGLDLHLDE